VIVEIEELMKYEAAGDPMTGTKWMRSTPQRIADILNSRGITISRNTVAALLVEMNFSLKANRKTIATHTSPGRDQQFRIIQGLRESFEATGNPMISVDTKKKELIGVFANSGRVWTRDPIVTNDHDFRSDATAIAVPYGLYDILANTGTVVVGTSSDTPAFAVQSIATWWRHRGRHQYSGRKALLILADGGGSNGYRPRAWKYELQKSLADRYDLTVTVAHYPTGASKWNPIEHRLFSEISKNWAGRPLDSLETMLNYIQTTRTEAGLEVRSYADRRTYAKGVKVSNADMKALALEKGSQLENWNYTIRPRASN
jgi:Rhodopirellula transposase DDE domain